MNSRPPVRLLEDPQAGARLREDLNATRAHAPFDYDVAVGLKRLRATLDGAAGAQSHPSPEQLAGAATSRALRWWGLSAAGLAVVGATWLAAVVLQPVRPAPQTPDASPLQAPSPAATKASETTTPTIASGQLEVAVPAETVDAPEQPEPTAAEPPSPAAGQSHAKSSGKHPVEARAQDKDSPHAHAAPRKSPVHEAAVRSAQGVDDPDALKLREIRQLAQARRELAADPTEALRLARAGQREFANGMFVQERGAIIIFALDALGRSNEARSAAEDHLRRYPDGPFSAQLDRIAKGLP